MKKIRQIVIYILTFVMIILSTGVMEVEAEDYTPYDMRSKETIDTYEKRQLAKEEAYKMKVQSNDWDNWPIGPSTYGEAAIVMEAESGAILYAKNIDGQGYPASITKVLTLLVALENANLEDTVTVTQEAIDCLGGGYAHIGLKVGEQLTLEDILYAVMLASANEAAHSLAASFGDGYDSFIEKMNARMKELGGTKSNFVNTNGVHDDEHYTTAREMALVTQELLLNQPKFEEICQTMQYTIGETNITSEARTFQQKHKMMLESSEFFDARVIAGKTGYTDYALNTLITCAEDENLKLIVVNLRTYEGALYPDTENLLNYGFDNFEKISITKNDLTTDVLSIKENSYVVVPKGVTMSDLEQEVLSETDGEGIIRYTYNGQNVGDIKISLKQEVVIEEDEAEENNEDNPFSLVKIIVLIGIVLALLLALYMILIIVVRYKRKKERQRRRALKRKRMMEMERERRRQMALEEERERRRQEYYRRNRRR